MRPTYGFSFANPRFLSAKKRKPRTDAERTGKTPRPRNNHEQTNLNPETPQASSGKEGGLLDQKLGDRNSHESGDVSP